MRIDLVCNDCEIKAFQTKPMGKIVLIPLKQAMYEQNMVVESKPELGYMIIGVKVKLDSTPKERANTLKELFTAEDINYAALVCDHNFEVINAKELIQSSLKNF